MPVWRQQRQSALPVPLGPASFPPPQGGTAQGRHPRRGGAWEGSAQLPQWGGIQTDPSVSLPQYGGHRSRTYMTGKKVKYSQEASKNIQKHQRDTVSADDVHHLGSSLPCQRVPTMPWEANTHIPRACNRVCGSSPECSSTRELW